MKKIILTVFSLVFFVATILYGIRYYSKTCYELCTEEFWTSSPTQWDIKSRLLSGININALGHGTPGQSASKRSPLHWAAEHGTPENVSYLLELGANPDGASPSTYFTPLHLVVKGAGEQTKTKNAIKKVRTLIEAGADLNAVNRSFGTALISAVKSENIKIIKMLLKLGAEINIVSERAIFGANALHVAASSGTPEIIKLLIESGADINVLNRGVTPLYEAASKRGKIKNVEILLKYNADINKGSSTPLSTAASNKNLNVMKMLIQAGAGVNLHNSAALHRSAYSGSAKNTQFLIDAGAKVNAKDKYARTPLHSAARGLNSENIAVLVNAGAELNALDRYGKAPLHYSAWDRGNRRRTNSSNSVIVAKKTQALLTAGADINLKDKDGNTPLLIASQNGTAQIISILLNGGADINVIGRDKGTVLHYAARSRSAKNISLLLSYNLDVNATDKNGKSPLHLASSDQQLSLVMQLIEAGADVDLRDKLKNTPLHYATNKDIFWTSRITSALLRAGANPTIRNKDNRPPFRKKIDLALKKMKESK